MYMLSFKELSKDLLIERSDADIEKCCVLFNLTEKLSEIISKFGNMIDPKDLHEYGIETEPHVTGLYGILPSERALTETQEVLKKFPKNKIKASLGECNLFQNPEFDVLKFDVLSQDLNDINHLLTKNLDYQNDFDDYHPHLTVAYLKPGTGQKYADKINSKLIGFPLDFGPPIFSDQNQNHTEMILGYPNNENVKHPDTGRMNEDLGYGTGVFPSGMPYMSGHLGTYNSPDVQIPRTADQYARYNMMNNNTVVSSGYYDTVFNADVYKVMAILKELGFKVKKHKPDDEYSVRGVKKADQTHTMANQSQIISSDDVMHDTSGINLGKDAVMTYLKQEVSDEDIEKMRENQEDPITYDEIYTGLQQQMRQMKYPDKDFATITVIKTLMKDQNYYSGLGRYGLNESNQLKGTTMKSDCNVNTKELGSIVRGMLAEKNKLGREAFRLMASEELEEVRDEHSIVDQIHNAIMNKGLTRISFEAPSGPLTYEVQEIWDDGDTLRISLLPKK